MSIFPFELFKASQAIHHQREEAGHQQVWPLYHAILTYLHPREGRVVIGTVPLIEAFSMHMLRGIAFRMERRVPRQLEGGIGHEIYPSWDGLQAKRARENGPPLTQQDKDEALVTHLRACDIIVWWEGASSGGDAS